VYNRTCQIVTLFLGHYFTTNDNTFYYALVKMSLDGHSSSVYQFLQKHYYNYFYATLHILLYGIFETTKFNRTSK
jgi:hypothetical protein